MRRAADAASVKLAHERGSCDAREYGIMARFSHKLWCSTASISIVCGGTSACIEPTPANIYIHKTLSDPSSLRIISSALLQRRGLDTEATWQLILAKDPFTFQALTMTKRLSLKQLLKLTRGG